MAIFKDCDFSVKEAIKSIEDLFKENRYVEMFEKASIKNSNSKNKVEAMTSFYKLLDLSVIDKMINENTIDHFFDGLENFLDNRGFTDSEKTSFFNRLQNNCIIEALNANRFPIAQKINLYREDKDIVPFYNFIIDKSDKENFEVIEQLLSLSTGTTLNHSEILRIIFNSGVRNYDYITKLIKKYNWDINGIGSTLEMKTETSFVHMVASGDGTISSQFFNKCVEEFNNQINFDIQTTNEYQTKLNLFDVILRSSLSSVQKLDRLKTILEHCDVSVKHIGYICQLLIDKEYYCNHYDHKIYDALFAHDNFNSEFFDREAILNKIVKNDTIRGVIRIRKNNNYTVNPTSLILSKIFNLAKPAVAMNKHPFITWIEGQNDNFSKDTLKSLIYHYGDDLLALDLRKIQVNYLVKSAIEEFGLIYPKSPSWRVMLSRDSEKKKMRLIRISHNNNQEEVISQEKKVQLNIAVDNISIALIEQVKDIDVKKLIESVHFNYQQYHSLGANRMMDDNVHYMTELLPKFLKTTLDNYLYLSMSDMENAKEEALVQLKLLNRKTFLILKDELERDDKDMEYKNAVHKKLMSNY